LTWQPTCSFFKNEVFSWKEPRIPFILVLVYNDEPQKGIPMSYIKLDPSNIEKEHICCAFSDKKCASSYQLKKQWLTGEFQKDYTFLRLDERAKVFIEYGPAENAWIPVNAPGYLALGCFWVSGKYKGTGHGKALVQTAIDEAKAQGKKGLVAVVGKTKFHFMSDGKWLLKQGFKETDTTSSGFSLLSYDFHEPTAPPQFQPEAKIGTSPDSSGYVVYYSNRCPYTEFHVKESLQETMEKRGLKFKVIKLKSTLEAQKAPTPGTIFSLFLDGQFVTTDMSVCMDSRFDKIIAKHKK
jgi:GNAT superfamily N-acetyltransferase